MSFSMETCKLTKMLSKNNRFGGNFFHELAESGSLALLKRVEPCIKKNHKVLLTLTDAMGRQCVHVAAMHLPGRRAIVMIENLVRLGANINANEAETEDSLLHMAVYTKNYDLAEWLCKQPTMIVDAENDEGWTAYQTAGRIGDRRMMTVLLKYGADRLPPIAESSL